MYVLLNIGDMLFAEFLTCLLYVCSVSPSVITFVIVIDRVTDIIIRIPVVRAFANLPWNQNSLEDSD